MDPLHRPAVSPPAPLQEPVIPGALPHVHADRPEMELRLTPDGRRVLVTVPPKPATERLP